MIMGKVSMAKSMVVAAAIVAGVSGMARANDSGVSPSIGDSHAYRNLPTTGSQIPDTSSLAWRQSHPNGLSVREMQSLWGSWAGQFHMSQPVFSSAPADTSFRESHPNGLSDREMQSLWGSWAGQYHMSQPVITNAAADLSFRESHPNGLSGREMQAMASEAPAWKMSKQTFFE